MIEAHSSSEVVAPLTTVERYANNPIEADHSQLKHRSTWPRRP